MTVKELIKLLTRYPENTEVFIMEEVKIKRQERLYKYYQPLTAADLIYGRQPTRRYVLRGGIGQGNGKAFK